MSLPISDDRYEAICRRIERRISNAAEFYIGRTNRLWKRRADHARRGTGVPGFEYMVHLDTFKGRRVCGEVEALLIDEFSGLLRQANLANDSRGGWGSGEQHLYLMWRTKQNVGR